MDTLKEQIDSLERLFNDYKETTDLRILELENKLNEKEEKEKLEVEKEKEKLEKLENKLKNEKVEKNVPFCMIKEELDITIIKYKKSLLVKSTHDYNTTQPYKDVFKELEGKWMKTAEHSGWIYIGKCSNDSVKENSKFIINALKEKEIEYTVIYK